MFHSIAFDVVANNRFQDEHHENPHKVRRRYKKKEKKKRKWLKHKSRLLFFLFFTFFTSLQRQPEPAALMKISAEREIFFFF